MTPQEKQPTPTSNESELSEAELVASLKSIILDLTSKHGEREVRKVFQQILGRDDAVRSGNNLEGDGSSQNVNNNTSSGGSATATGGPVNINFYGAQPAAAIAPVVTPAGVNFNQAPAQTSAVPEVSIQPENQSSPNVDKEYASSPPPENLQPQENEVEQLSASAQNNEQELDSTIVNEGRDTEAEAIREVDLLSEIDPNLRTSLEEARNHYAFITAKDRQSYLGRFKTRVGKDGREKESLSGRLIRKIWGLKGYIEKHDQEFELAIEDYREAVDRVIREISIYHSSRGASDESVEMVTRAELINQDLELEKAIVDYRHMRAKKAGKLTNAWVNGGKIKKAAIAFAAGALGGAVVAGAGLAIGIGSVVGAGFMGAAGGGATGIGLAGRITKRRANAVYNARNRDGYHVTTDGRTVAESQSARDHEKMKGLLNSGDIASSEIITFVTENRSKEEMVRNNQRWRRARTLGAIAAGGLAGYGLREGLVWTKNHDWDWPWGGDDGVPSVDEPGATEPPGGDEGPDHNGKDRVDDNPDDKGDVGNNDNEGKDNSGGDKEVPPEATEIVGNDFYVEPGHGLTQEWQDWAKVNGQKLNGENAWKLHNAIRNHFGDSGIFTGGTYVENGDLRISSPGNVSWKKGVAEFAQNWMNKRGLWK